ncbi:MAG: hypothetical protein OXC02_03890 [Rhodobacteraceae bacterium]|nr:hypothetical protein [Paracoccaceae bacterium]
MFEASTMLNQLVIPSGSRQNNSSGGDAGKNYSQTPSGSFLAVGL